MKTNPPDVQIRILIIDDEESIGDILFQFLSKKDYETFYSDNSTDGITLVKRARPHIVLLDVNLGGADGIDLLQEIKQIDPRIGVIMITASRENEVGREALKLGASDFIPKPIDLDYLDTSVKLKIAALLE